MTLAEREVPAAIDQAELRSEICEVVRDPDLWLSSPNDQLGGLAPRDLMDTPEGRSVLHSLVQSIKHGMPT
jgi:uncharacterized protein (DUF2384 family)